MSKHKYEVDVMERWARTFIIESDSPLTKDELQAKANGLSGDGTQEGVFEYSDTLEPEEWTVRELSEDGEVKDWL